MKVSELTGAELDYWVAKAEGHSPEPVKMSDRIVYALARHGFLVLQAPSYSTDWAKGGPIIERERIQLSAPPSGEWIGITYSKGRLISPEADTLLVAAMRAYVVSKFGEEVDGIRESAAHLSAQS